jgi:hypothetical protein
MSLVWVEDGDSRQATIVRRGKKAASTMTKSYKLFGTANDVEVHAAVNQQISTVGYGWQYPGVADAQLWAESYSIAFLGDNAWQVTINYEKSGAEPTTPDPMKRARSFDTTGGTQHVTQAADERAYGILGQTPPSQFNAIGVDDNGVNGVDIVTPQLQWQESYDVPNAYINATYVRGLAGMTGTTNNAAFRGFEAGEVLFVGCSGSQEWDDEKGSGPWSLSYRFVASKNVTGERIGGIFVDKKGHEYLWVRYENDVSGYSLLKKPIAVYVNRVYRESNFALLGIGTGYT